MTIILFSCISNKGEQPNEDCKLLNDQDLLLVIETEFQKDMLLKHGAMVVCMDTTYNVNNYNIHLIWITSIR